VGGIFCTSDKRVITATSCISVPKLWKPGGVVLAILGPWAQRVSKISRDDLGRWASATLTGSDGNSFTLISLYNVVNVQLQDAGPSTIFAQQYRLLRLAKVLLISNPRQQCIDDLHRTVAKMIANQETVMIMGDFNESLGSDPRLMGSVCASHDLFDVISNFHGESAEIPTYARGTKRLNYAAASSSLRHLICACGYNLFNEHIHLDHHTSFVDLRLKDCFGHVTPSLASPDLRFVSSSSPAVKQFVRKMHSHLRENKVFHSYQEFRLDREILDAPWRMANKIDSLIGQAFHAAETSCYKPPKPPWSEKLHIASLTVRCWKTALMERLTKVPQSAVLHNLSAEIWKSTPPTIPTRTKILKSVGTAAQRALRHIRKNAVKEREAFLTELKSRLAQRMATKDTDPVAAIQNIDRQLQDTRRFRRIARAIKPQPSSSLTKVEIVHMVSHLHPVTGKVVETTTVKTVDTRQALEEAIIERNKRHVAQADGTPFTKFPLSKISSDNGYNVFEDVEGHEIRLPEDSFVETKMIMELLQERHRDPGTKWSEGVSFNKFISGLLHWN
jgi:hypothetical protein